jgi:NAD+ synthase
VEPSILLAQINTRVGDIAGNAGALRRAWARAPDGAVVAGPELALLGYPPGDIVLRPAVLEAVEAQVAALAAESARYGAALLVGAPWREGGRLYNAVHLIAGGAVRGTAAKVRLPSYGVFAEHRLFAPGPAPRPLEWRGGRLGVLVCEDTWAPGPAAALARRGAQVLISLNASPYEGPGKAAARLAAARARVAETGLPLAYVNQVGGQDALVFDGGSFALDATGAVVAQAAYFEEVAVLKRQGAQGASAPEGDAGLYAALVLAVRDYAAKNGFARALLGLSGGVDSALVAAIAADALGPAHVEAIALPTRFTAQRSLDDAAAVADMLGIGYAVQPIEDALQAMEALTGHTAGTPHENLQARIRGAALMTRANADGALLLATGNKSELAVGYCTLYGDMCGGFAPIGDVYKTQVYALARARGLPASVLERAPTAELRPGQADTDALPPYDVLDGILRALIERDARPDGPEAARVWAMLLGAEHKRRQAPPAPKVSPRALRDDRVWPITLDRKETP